MAESQLTEIRDYLLERKLPLDILLEVQDHFVSQINDLQAHEQLDFEAAFQKTKNSWQNELKPYWDGGWDLWDKNNMVRKFERMMLWTTLKKSAFYALAALLILLIAAVALPLEIYKYFSLVLLGLVSVYPIYNYILKFKSFTLARKYPDYVITLYQSFAFINFIFIFQFYGLFTNFDKYAFNFKNFLTDFSPIENSFLLIVYFFVFLISFFALISQKEYLKRLEKVKPFLQYLKPSS